MENGRDSCTSTPVLISLRYAGVFNLSSSFIPGSKNHWVVQYLGSSIADIWGGGGKNGFFVYEKNRELKKEQWLTFPCPKKERGKKGGKRGPIV